jgi:hypothetical protein
VFQEPFQHESLLVDRKEKKLSQAEKRLAQRSYELEKQANINYNRPQYPVTQPGLQIRWVPRRPKAQGSQIGEESSMLEKMFSLLTTLERYMELAAQHHCPLIYRSVTE